MLIPKVTVGLHGQRAAVSMAKPPRHGWDVDPAFDCDGREEMAQIVMSDPRHADELGCPVDRLLALSTLKCVVLRVRQTSLPFAYARA